jgi:large exoprotein involved in heme utilization and adhesion
MPGLRRGSLRAFRPILDLLPGKAGEVRVSAGSLAITNGGQISAATHGPGAGGDVAVMVTGDVVMTGRFGIPSGIIASTIGSQSRGQAGKVVLTAGGAIALSGGAQIASTTGGVGSGGSVQVTAGGLLSSTDRGSGIIASATSAASGDAGSVVVTAPQITLMRGGEISSTTAGMGMGDSVSVMTPGALVLDGAGVANTQIAASATGPQSQEGGSVTVGADTLTVKGGAQIASTTAGPGKGGDIAVTVVNGVTLSGSGPNGASGISAAALPGSSGAAGEVVLTAGGAIALSGGAKASSSTAGAGSGGSVQVIAGGLLSLTDPGSGIIASATSVASGDAGSVMVTAPQIAVMTGGEISSTTAGTGKGGSVMVTTPGALVLDGAGVANTQIAASATGPQSGPAGSVTVKANALTVEGGAEIASTTAGPGKGGDINVMVASDIALPDRGPQITAVSTGSGDAGSITVSAVRLLLNNGAAISTEGKASTANGGNITLHVRDFLYLVSSEITTSVKGETGNGGNITIDPQLVILDHSRIRSEAIQGHGGDINITAGELIRSSDSIISATSQLGISGTVEINGPRVDVNGALVVLSSELRGRAAVLREACAAQRPPDLEPRRGWPGRTAAGPRSDITGALYRRPRP